MNMKKVGKNIWAYTLATALTLPIPGFGFNSSKQKDIGNEKTWEIAQSLEANSWEPRKGSVSVEIGTLKNKEKENYALKLSYDIDGDGKFDRVLYFRGIETENPEFINPYGRMEIDENNDGEPDKYIGFKRDPRLILIDSNENHEIEPEEGEVILDKNSNGISGDEKFLGKGEFEKYGFKELRS